MTDDSTDREPDADDAPGQLQAPHADTPAAPAAQPTPTPAPPLTSSGPSAADERGPTKAEALADAQPADVRELNKQLARDHGRLDLRLKKLLGYGGLVVLPLQLVVADTVFIIYGFSNSWMIPAGAISAWLGACVVQIFLIVRAITSYAFPPGSSPRGVQSPGGPDGR